MDSLRDRVAKRVREEAWAATAVAAAEEAARWWIERSDETLWGLMFGTRITRAWMVWSDGYCPSCRGSVPMYNWKFDAFRKPWTMWCPHCGEVFPKNDFAAFHASGLDARGLFDPARADRSLLFHAEHGAAGDPLRLFGVDDGEGYSDGDRRWRFIGAYLVYGQWKQLVVEGIRRLAAAYALTGAARYAHKAVVLLDRVADFYPEFDHKTQATMYNDVHTEGFVSTWHDACEETREMALAWEQVRDIVERDPGLVEFLADRSRRYATALAKTGPADICRNIDDRILREALRQPHKIHSNYPRREICMAVIHRVLGGEENRREWQRLVDDMITGATRVDGVTGEKGLAGYSSFTIQSLAVFLADEEQRTPGFLRTLFERHPRLHLTWRFFVDTLCLDAYYPQIGDTGWFGHRVGHYVGVSSAAVPLASVPMSLAPSPATFLWTLYQVTGDPAYVQMIYLNNGRRLEGLPGDLGGMGAAEFQRAVKEVLDRAGPVPILPSIDKKEWHLALLRSGTGDHRRAVWLDYDTGGNHSHQDGMNLGLFARGLDLMPDFGYPPVQYHGGWNSPEAEWYYQTAAHNSVVVDGTSTPALWSDSGARILAGRTRLWGDGVRCHLLQVAGAEIYHNPEIRQYERTIVLVDINDEDFYILDIFRVVGGKDHAKFLHSHYGALRTEGLTLTPTDETGFGPFLRHFRTDGRAAVGWNAVWEIEDRYRYLPVGSDVRFRYTDLTEGASVSVCEGWINAADYNTCGGEWIPRLLIRRGAESAPLSSTFVGVMEPSGRASALRGCRRLRVMGPREMPYPDNYVGVEVELADGRRDLILAADREDPLHRAPFREGLPLLAVQERDVAVEGEIAWVRQQADGRPEAAALAAGRKIAVGTAEIFLPAPVEFREFLPFPCA